MQLSDPTTPPVVLIIDDDDIGRALAASVLSGDGYEVLEAPDGLSGLALLHKESVDVVLLDVLMPGMSGLDVLKAIRQHRSTTDLPVIMVTALDDPVDVVRALKAGANDYVTRPVNDAVLLARVQTQTALARRSAALELANRQMRKELDAATALQRSLLPNGHHPVSGARFAWNYRPCTALAGDLLNVAPIDEDHVALYVLDVVGHGVRAALWAVMVNQELTRLFQGNGPSPREPALVAQHLNRLFPFDEREQFFTLAYGVLQPASGEFHFVCAGHPGPLLLPCVGKPALQKVHSSPIGLGDGYYDECRLQLGPGDRLYLYSDGVTEAVNPAEGALGGERFGQLLADHRTASLADGLSRLIQGVETWCAPEAPHDDISILAVERA